MKISKQDLEKKLIEIKGQIDHYEAKRKELCEMPDTQKEIEETNKRLQELWAEFRKIYFHLKGKHQKTHNSEELI